MLKYRTHLKNEISLQILSLVLRASVKSPQASSEKNMKVLVFI